MIHHWSVRQITDRPSPLRCSSESHTNWSDTSNDSAHKQTHMQVGKKKYFSRWVSQTIAPQSMTAAANMAPNWGVCLNGTIVSLRQTCDFSQVVTATLDPGVRWESWAPYWSMCFPLTSHWVGLQGCHVITEEDRTTKSTSNSIWNLLKLVDVHTWSIHMSGFLYCWSLEWEVHLEVH